MGYLIDGHNLIPHVRGLSLRALDDEQKLVELLQAFCQARRKPLEVFFDNAPPGMSKTRSMGQVKAHFIRAGNTADEAIIARVHQLKRTAGNWTVVSSDRHVITQVRALGAKTLSSEEFARDLSETQASGSQKKSGRSGEHPSVEPPLSQNEVEEWLRLFSQKKKP